VYGWMSRATASATVVIAGKRKAANRRYSRFAS
jgi:hypothetical protein